MKLSDEERQEMVRLEIERAKKNIDETDYLQAGQLWNNLASRLYYAVFHAVSALTNSRWPQCFHPQRLSHSFQPTLYQNWQTTRRIWPVVPPTGIVIMTLNPTNYYNA